MQRFNVRIDFESGRQEGETRCPQRVELGPLQSARRGEPIHLLIFVRSCFPA
jgi:hypothetical protein